MQSMIFFRASSGNDYELKVEHDEGADVPAFLSEGPDGIVVDLLSDSSWPSIAEMTQERKLEILEWGSEIGD